MKSKTIACCQQCGAQMPRWVGRCSECGVWGSVVEEPVTAPSRPGAVPTAQALPLSQEGTVPTPPLPTGTGELDRVLGGGVVRGATILLAGEPGIGKSTLALQAALGVGAAEEVLLVCGEEAPEQVRSRAERLGGIPARVKTLADPSLGAVLAVLEAAPPGFCVVDSIQTVFSPDIGAAPGSVSQVRECGSRLARAAREHGCALLLVGHVTKEGTVAGPRVLEHLVDVVLAFDGERSGGVRVLRAQKNRFGSTQEAGFFEMVTEGLVAIRDASRYLLADRCAGLPGSVLAVCLEGRRPFVCEVQALVTRSGVNAPRRTGIGVDATRLPALVAVVERLLALKLGQREVYVSAVGGLRAAEPATDLAVVAALLSAWWELAIPPDVAAFGEVGLAGEVRRVPGAGRRLGEAAAVGCRRVLVPAGLEEPAPDGVELVRVRHLGELATALERLASGPPPLRVLPSESMRE